MTKKDESYYKKQYKKLKKNYSTQMDDLLENLVFFQGIITILCKNSKTGEVVISASDIGELKKTERSIATTDKQKNIIFKLEGNKK